MFALPVPGNGVFIVGHEAGKYTIPLMLTNGNLAGAGSKLFTHPAIGQQLYQPLDHQVLTINRHQKTGLAFPNK